MGWYYESKTEMTDQEKDSIVDASIDFSKIVFDIDESISDQSFYRIGQKMFARS